MNPSLRITLIVALVIYFAALFHLLRRKKLELKFSLLWLLCGVLMILVLAFPRAFGRLMSLLGIVESVNGVFAAVLFGLLIILISITAIVSKQSADIRRLTQVCALQEKRLRELENERKDSDITVSAS